MMRREDLSIQQPNSDNEPVDDGPTVAALGAAMAVGSVTTVEEIVEPPAHGDAEGINGVGPMICGLVPSGPASVAVRGIVPSLNTAPVTVERPGIGTIAVLAKASLASWAPTAGLQAPVVSDGLNDVPGGAVAPGRSCGDIAPVVPTALFAGTTEFSVGANGPVVAHDVIVPTVPDPIAAEVCGTNWIAPRALAPGARIVPIAAPGAGI
jgi:hypothetical protein